MVLDRIRRLPTVLIRRLLHRIITAIRIRIMRMVIRITPAIGDLGSHYSWVDDITAATAATMAATAVIMAGRWAEREWVWAARALVVVLRLTALVAVAAGANF